MNEQLYLISLIRYSYPRTPLILQFKHYVRTLVFSSVYYTRIDRESFLEELDGECGIDVDEDPSYYDHSFKLYRTARKNQQAHRTNGTSSAYLSFALASLPNIRKIVLTDTSSSRSMSYQSYKTYQPPILKACPLEDCGLSDHFPHAVIQSGFSAKGSTNPWRSVLFALSVTNTNVKELTMEPRNMELNSNTAAFSIPPDNINQLKLCFQSLTKIRFSFLVDPKRFSTKFGTRYVHQNVAKLLRSAVNLESLSLDLMNEEGHDHSTLKELLGRSKFPKLRSLNLAFLASTESELLRLLKHSRSLENLTIGCYWMIEGLWTKVANWIRASLPLLKHAELNTLYGGFEDPWDSLEYYDVYGYINDFLFCQGDNPFTTKALEKYNADTEAERKPVNPFGGLGFIEAYTKYH